MPIYSNDAEGRMVEVALEPSEPPAPAPPAPAAESVPSSDAPGETSPASAPESPPSDVEPPAPADEPRGEGGFQRRIKTLVSQRNELREANARLQAQNDLLQRQAPASSPPQTPPAAVPPATAKPRQEDYATSEEWVEALTDWKTQDAIQRTIRERDAQAATQRHQTLVEQVQARFVEGQIKYEDFDEVTSNPESRIAPELIPIVQEVMAHSEYGADIAYYLGQHPHEAHELNDRTTQGARKWLQALARKLATAPAPPVPPPAPVAPAATRPPPLTPLRGTGSIPVVQDAGAIAEANGSLLDYMKAMKYRE